MLAATWALTVSIEAGAADDAARGALTAERQATAAAAPTSMPVGVVGGSAAVLGTGALVAGIVQADAGAHPYLVGTGLGLLTVGVPATLASLTTDEPTTMQSPGMAAGGVALMAVGAGTFGTGVIAAGGGGEGTLGAALIAGGAAALGGGIALTVVGNQDDPRWAEERAARSPEPPPEPGTLTTAGTVGAVMTVSGVVIVIAGGATVLVGASGSASSGSLDGLTDSAIMVGGGIGAGTGLLVTAVGASLWARGTNDPTPRVTLGPTSVGVEGTF